MVVWGGACRIWMLVFAVVLLNLSNQALAQVSRQANGDCRSTIGVFPTQFGPTRLDVWTDRVATSSGLIIAIPIGTAPANAESRPLTGIVQVGNYKTTSSMNTRIVGNTIEVYYQSPSINFQNIVAGSTQIVTGKQSDRNEKNPLVAAAVGDLPSMTFRYENATQAVAALQQCSSDYKVMDSIYSCLDLLSRYESACPKLSWRLISRGAEELVFAEINTINRTSPGVVEAFIYRQSTFAGRDETLKSTLVDAKVQCSNLTITDVLRIDYDSASQALDERRSFYESDGDQRALLQGLRGLCDGKISRNPANPMAESISVRNKKQSDAVDRMQRGRFGRY